MAISKKYFLLCLIACGTSILAMEDNNNYYLVKNSLALYVQKKKDEEARQEINAKLGIYCKYINKSNKHASLEIQKFVKGYSEEYYKKYGTEGKPRRLLAQCINAFIDPYSNERDHFLHTLARNGKYAAIETILIELTSINAEVVNKQGKKPIDFFDNEHKYLLDNSAPLPKGISLSLIEMGVNLIDWKKIKITDN